jgi:exodeoxyribonuclease III
MKVISWNINGLSSGRLGVQALVLQEKPDVLCLQEIKCSEKTATDIMKNIGFEHIYVNAADKPGYSGVLMACRSKPSKILTVPKTLPEITKEGRIVAVEYEKQVIVCCYSPHSKRDLSRLEYRCESWEPWLQTWIKNMMSSKPVILAGDLNVVPEEIDIHNPKVKTPRAGYTDEERECFADLLEGTGLVDSFRSLHPKMVKYSFWSPMASSRERNKGWRVDFVLCDPRIKIAAADILTKYMGSDHCPVVAKI